jgi:diguanylate cyclase (GGDEF)-like protein/PAS domain S-box-containing protein
MAEEPRSSRIRRTLWRWYLLVGAAVAVAYFLVPSDVVQGALFAAISLTVPIALLWGVALHRPPERLPWLALVAGTVLYSTANVPWYLYPKIVGRPLSFPSMADAVYIMAYGFLLIGLIALVRSRSRGDRGGLIDALIVTLGLSVFWWSLVIAPYVEVSGLTMAQRVVSISYPLADVALVGVVVVLIIARGTRGPAFWLLLGSLVAQTVADTAYAQALLHGTFAFGTPLFLGWLVAYPLLGAAALHPSMQRLAQPATGPDSASRLRLVLMATAALVPTVILGISRIPEGDLDGVFIAAIAGVAFLAAMNRLRMLMVDVSEFRRAESALRESEARYRALVERVPAVTYVADPGPEGAWRYVSPQIEQLLGFSPKDWVADPTLWARRIHPDDRERVVTREMHLAQAATDREPSAYPALAAEYRMLARDGRVVWVRDEAFFVPDEEGVPATLRGILVDITERKSLEEELSRQAFMDSLTGLPNRALFHDRLEQALARAGRDDTRLAVLILDLNSFKSVNDSLGHLAGDRILRELADRLRGCVRGSDTAARLGGDEFAVLLEGANAPDAAAIAGRILTSLAMPFVVEGRELFLDGSVGIAEAHGPMTMDEVLRDADAAMYAAKLKGKGAYEIYQEVLHADVLEQLELSSELRRALERKEFILHYQPLVILPMGEVVGLEALVRWIHPTRGLVAPGDFIPVAEEAGLISAIDRWVLREACRRGVEWNRRSAEPEGIRMHVNISARHLHDVSVVDHVAGILAESGLEPGLLTLEITEGTLMHDAESAVRVLDQLKALGIRLAIDDFGIGFSSLSYLRRLPVDVVKIDRAFVSGLADDPAEWGLARGIVKLVHGLGLETVAEGIERADQVAHLRALGCDRGQGFYFARPVEEAGVGDILERRVLLPAADNRTG